MISLMHLSNQDIKEDWICLVGLWGVVKVMGKTISQPLCVVVNDTQ